MYIQSNSANKVNKKDQNFIVKTLLVFVFLIMFLIVFCKLFNYPPISLKISISIMIPIGV